MTLDVHSKRTRVMEADYADHEAEIREALHDECSRLAAELETVRASVDRWRAIALRALVGAAVLGGVVAAGLGYLLGRL